MRELAGEDRRRLEEELKRTYGLTLPQDLALVASSRRRIRACSRRLLELDLSKLNPQAYGVYICSIEKQGARLSMDAAQLFNCSRKLKVSWEQAKAWLRGEDIEVSANGHGFIVLEHNGYVLGVGFLSGGRVRNYVPKSRRIPE
ncbi:MAG: hypothetical protein DRN96_04590 [Thermoproteota archaeon]|nr:MAG: hypothetical protein DRN96_04590 [Candidatus Korarchaeota archaeon]